MPQTESNHNPACALMENEPVTLRFAKWLPTNWATPIGAPLEVLNLPSSFPKWLLGAVQLVYTDNLVGPGPQLTGIWAPACSCNHICKVCRWSNPGSLSLHGPFSVTGVGAVHTLPSAHCYSPSEFTFACPFACHYQDDLEDAWL